MVVVRLNNGVSNLFGYLTKGINSSQLIVQRIFAFIGLRVSARIESGIGNLINQQPKL